MRASLAALLLASTTLTSPAVAETLAVEKPELKFGFIKLTDMAPLAIAKEKGFFEDEGLYVTLQPQANWKVLLDGVISGQLDGAHMLAGQPLAATIGSLTPEGETSAGQSRRASVISMRRTSIRTEA